MRLRAIWLRVVLTGALAFGLSACGPELLASPTPAPSVLDSGIRGIVLLSPTCAVQLADASPCVKPYVARLVIADTDGNTVAEVTSASDGTFEVKLPAGDYTIQPEPGDGGDPSGTPQSVTVAPDDYVDVEIDYDTGIR